VLLLLLLFWAVLAAGEKDAVGDWEASVEGMGIEDGTADGAGEAAGDTDSDAPVETLALGVEDAPFELLSLIVGDLLGEGVAVRVEEMEAGVYTLGLRLLPKDTLYTTVGRKFMGAEES
jgi:hypothetical protein